MIHYTMFEFFDTVEQAETFCKEWDKKKSQYMRKKHPAHFTPWTSKDGKEHKFVAFYYI